MLRAGHGQQFTVTLTVGTGLGGGVVLGGELVRGAFGAAAEVGHMVLVPGGSLRVDSRQGQGTRLLVELPIDTGQPPDATKPPTAAASAVI